MSKNHIAAQRAFYLGPAKPDGIGHKGFHGGKEFFRPSPDIKRYLGKAPEIICDKIEGNNLIGYTAVGSFKQTVSFDNCSLGSGIGQVEFV